MKRSALVAVASAVLAGACGGAAEETAAPPPASVLQDALALPEIGFPRYQELIEELRGTPVVVNIWGSWCGPCHAEAPHLASVSREFEGRVEFLGVDILDDRASARRFIRRYGWEYPQVFDPDAEIRDGLGLLGQPVTLIYDRSGTIAFRWVGAVTDEMLRAEIRKVL